MLLGCGQALGHEPLDSVSGVTDQQRHLAALGPGEVVKHVVGGIHPPRWTPDADPNAQIVPRAEGLGDRPQPVMATLAAAELEPYVGERDVELVVDHDEVLDGDLVERQQPGDRPT